MKREIGNFYLQSPHDTAEYQRKLLKVQFFVTTDPIYCNDDTVSNLPTVGCKLSGYVSLKSSYVLNVRDVRVAVVEAFYRTLNQTQCGNKSKEHFSNQFNKWFYAKFYGVEI